MISEICGEKRRPDESGERCSECRVSSERAISRSGIKPIDDVCGRAESRSGEDGRQREDVVAPRPVASCHVFLILESTVVEIRTTDGARVCGRHLFAVSVRA